MNVNRYICPGCGAEEKVIADEDNLSFYIEAIIDQKCQECSALPPTAEDRLLGAIFGEKSG